MSTSTPPVNTSKTLALQTALKNPKIMRAVKDAMNAPIGSTKRKYASAVLSGITKIASNRFDGMGGPGPAISNPPAPPSPWDRFNLPTVGALPPLKRAPAFGPSKPQANDGMGGPGPTSNFMNQSYQQSQQPTTPAMQNSTMTGGAQGIIPRIGSFLGKTIFSPENPVRAVDAGLDAASLAAGAAQTGLAALGMAGGMAEAGKNWLGNKLWYGTDKLNTDWKQTQNGQIAKDIINYPTAATARINERYPSLGGTNKPLANASGSTAASVAGTTATKESDLETKAKSVNSLYQKYFNRNASDAEMKNWVKEAPEALEIYLKKDLDAWNAKNGTKTQGPQPLAPGAGPSSQFPGVASATSGSYSSSGSAPTVPNVGDVSATSSSGPASTGGAISGNGATGWAGIQSAVVNAAKNGMGSQATAEMVLNDPKLRAELAKLFPGVPEWAIPKGASLSNQLNDLKEAKKLELGLDDLYNKRQKMVSQGYSLTDDLTNYVRGHDEYVTKLDKMINESSSNVQYSGDLSDPRIRARYDQWKDYLYIQKGKQNKRYTDVLNDSINQHNQQLQQIDNSYQMAQQKLSDYMTSTSAITTEAYTRMYQSLTSLYDGITSAGANSTKIAQAEANLTRTQLLNMKTMADMSTGGGSDKKGDYDKGVGFAEDYIDKSNGYIMPAVNIPNAFKMIKSSNYDDNALNSFWDSMLNKVVNSFTKVRDKNLAGDLTEVVGRTNRMIKSFQDGKEDLRATIGSDAVSNLDAILTSKVDDLVRAEMGVVSSQMTGDGAKLKTAIQKLLGGEKTFLGFGKPTPSMTGNLGAWKNTAKALGIRSDIIDMLEPVLQSAISRGIDVSALFVDPNNPTKPFSSMSAQEVENAVTNALSGYVRSQFVGNLTMPQ